MFEVYLPIANMTVNGLNMILLGALVGFLAGLFGVGGGFVMAPVKYRILSGIAGIKIDGLFDIKFKTVNLSNI